MMTAKDPLVRYLLHLPDNDGPETDRESIEGRLFCEDGFGEQLEDTERQLIDLYVRGELPSDLAARVESELLSGAGAGEKLAVARWMKENRPASGRPKAAVAAVLALAAALVAVVFVSVLHRRATPVVPAAPVVAARKVQPVPEQPAVAFLLTPGVTRGESIPAITIPAAVGVVRFDLADVQASRSASVSLQDAQQRVIWQQQGLTSRLGGASVFIGASLLKPGEYRLAIAGNPPIEYYFRIVTRPGA